MESNNHIILTIKIEWGTAIWCALKEAHKLGEKLNVVIKFKFNKYTFYINSKSNIKEIAKKYYNHYMNKEKMSDWNKFIEEGLR